MSPLPVTASPETLLANGQLDEALRALSAEVRSRPADARLRVFLFQLQALLGEWARAERQLAIAHELDPQNALMASAYGTALRGEIERAAVMAGSALPPLAGKAEPWHAPLVQSLAALCSGHMKDGLALRNTAFDAAPAVAGRIDGEPFDWIADADPRFGPCLEVILKAGYTWVPFSQVRSLDFEAPSDLRDKIWTPVRIGWQAGGEAVGFVPCRYPGSEHCSVAALTLAARTTWLEQDADCFVGQGQRMLVTDRAEHSLLDVRSITFDAR